MPSIASKAAVARLLLLAGLVWTCNLNATVVERLSLDSLVSRAHSVVTGRVREVRSHWDSNRRLILTDTTIDIGETLKGAAARSLVITTLGGRVGNSILHVSGMPQFEVGEETIVFVERSGAYSTVLGLTQGKFTVRGTEVFADPSLLERRGAASPVPGRTDAREFKRQIRDRVGRIR